MLSIEKRIRDLAKEKKCCAQIVMTLGLEAEGSANPELVQAMKGLCYGLHSQQNCGALSGGACLLALYNEDHAKEMVKELVDWFTEGYGSVDCVDILGPGNTDPLKCLEIITETSRQCFAILEKHQLLVED